MVKANNRLDGFAPQEYYPEVSSSDDSAEPEPAVGAANSSMELVWKYPTEYDLPKHLPKLFHTPTKPSGLRGKAKREWSAGETASFVAASVLDGKARVTIDREVAAQLCDLLRDTPSQNHFFYLTTPASQRSDRHAWKESSAAAAAQQEAQRQPTRLKALGTAGDMTNAWNGIGRDRTTMAPFGPRVETDFSRVAGLNDRSLRQIGMIELADALKAGGKAEQAGAQHEAAMRATWAKRRSRQLEEQERVSLAAQGGQGLMGSNDHATAAAAAAATAAAVHREAELRAEEARAAADAAVAVAEEYRRRADAALDAATAAAAAAAADASSDDGARAATDESNIGSDEL